MERATLEVIAPTVDEAVEKGLQQLGLNRERVEVEILDEGGGGLFGFGDRQARVRLAVLEVGEVAAAEKNEVEVRPRHRITEFSGEELENIMSIARATVLELLDNMNIRADVETRLGEISEHGTPPIIVNIEGGDLSVLIGRGAETLDSLQLITRMIVGKEIGQSAHLIVDVQGYRERREQNLRQLAQRMANQAIRTGRRQMLEPMTPAERRIIHVELAENDEVTTESTGQDPKRKVVIIPR